MCFLPYGYRSGNFVFTANTTSKIFPPITIWTAKEPPQYFPLPLCGQLQQPPKHFPWNSTKLFGEQIAKNGPSRITNQIANGSSYTTKNNKWYFCLQEYSNDETKKKCFAILPWLLCIRYCSHTRVACGSRGSYFPEVNFWRLAARARSFLIGATGPRHQLPWLGNQFSGQPYFGFCTPYIRKASSWRRTSV